MEGQDAYIFKDEVSQAYTKLDAITGTLALKLDGTLSPDDLLEFARSEWPGLEFDEDFIADVLSELKRLKFLDDPFERNAMIEARVRQDRAQINSTTFRNIFSIPLGTVDPDRFLTRAYPCVAFLFRPFFVALGIALFAFSGCFVWLNRDHIAGGNALGFLGSGQPLLAAFILWLVVTLATIIHELGHGFAVKHFGGKVHRLGFIFVFGMPCMFCDTSDSHLFPQRRSRACVALAGTYTELYVGSLATLVWWLTPSGSATNQIAYTIILFASVGGILFNYNPLIKMDGYFVLADLLDLPNLQEDAYEYLGYLFRRRVLGVTTECPVEGRRRKQILATYGILSILYSAAITVVMYIIFRARLIESLAFVGSLLSVLLLWVVLQKVFRPMANGARLWVLDHRGWIRQRMVTLVALAALLVGLFFLMPVPGQRALPATLRPGREIAVVAQDGLRLEQSWVTAGMPVEAGTLLARLDPDSLVLDRAEVAAEARTLRMDAVAARAQGADAASAAADQRADAETERANLLGQRVRRTELRAPFAGVVLTPSQPERIGEWLEPGDTLCIVGDFARVRAEMEVTEMDLDEVRVGAPVRMRLRADPGRSLHGKVAAIEPSDEATVEGRSYRVWVQLDDAPPVPRAGLTGRAWIVTPSRSPASHLVRWLARFLRTDLWV